MTSSTTDEIDHEQSYVDQLYARLDQLRERTAAELATVRRTAPTGTHQNRSERDAFAQLHEDRLAQLMAVEDRLPSAGSTSASGTSRYVGRLGLSDDEQHPAAGRLACTRGAVVLPGDGGLARRRRTPTPSGHPRPRRGRAWRTRSSTSSTWTAPSARPCPARERCWRPSAPQRTGRMADIVATIQGEQDRVIRSDLDGVLVVQGGPGTGKTAVALHRAAYLLYTYRERLARSGVLVVGPNSAVPALHRAGAALPRRDRRRDVDARRALSRHRRRRGRGTRGGRAQGRPADGSRRGPRRPRAGAGARRRAPADGRHVRDRRCAPRSSRRHAVGPAGPASRTTRRGRATSRTCSDTSPASWPRACAPS